MFDDELAERLAAARGSWSSQDPAERRRITQRPDYLHPRRKVWRRKGSGVFVFTCPRLFDLLSANKDSRPLILPAGAGLRVGVGFSAGAGVGSSGFAPSAIAGLASGWGTDFPVGRTGGGRADIEGSVRGWLSVAAGDAGFTAGVVPEASGSATGDSTGAFGAAGAAAWGVGAGSAVPLAWISACNRPICTASDARSPSLAVILAWRASHSAISV